MQNGSVTTPCRDTAAQTPSRADGQSAKSKRQPKKVSTPIQERQCDVCNVSPGHLAYHLRAVRCVKTEQTSGAWSYRG